MDDKKEARADGGRRFQREAPEAEKDRTEEGVIKKDVSSVCISNVYVCGYFCVMFRFFTLSSPSHETKFFQELKRGHCSSNNQSSPTQEDLASESDEEQGSVEDDDEEEEEEEEVIQDKSEKKPSEFCNSAGGKTFFKIHSVLSWMQ